MKVEWPGDILYTWFAIYALCEPDDGDAPPGTVRYVGFTHFPARRFKVHLKRTIKCHTWTGNWLQYLQGKGLLPTFKILEEGYYRIRGDWEAAEQKWIALFRDGPWLTNHLAGGQGATLLEGAAGEATRNKLRKFANSPEHKAQLATLHAGPENKARLAAWAHSPECKAQRAINGKSPENLARLAVWVNSPERKSRVATRNASPEKKAQLTTWANRPENKARFAAWANSPENKSRLATRNASPENKARVATQTKARWDRARAAGCRNLQEYKARFQQS